MFTDTFTREGKRAVRVESDTSNGTTYVANAAPGSLEAEEVWQIQKIVDTTVGTVTTTVITFPNGDNTYRYSWTDRASYSFA